jgi:hypothetical protein
MSQTTANTLGTAGQNMASNVGEAYQNAANARASGYVGGANAITGGLGTYLNYSQGQNMLGALRGGGGGIPLGPAGQSFTSPYVPSVNNPVPVGGFS